ncbi:MAG: conserved rane protein of unknown function [Patescibacteria group bacterium]|nr:conserved rane protein of unknown function [Patescibacteria group bacterium]
MKLIAFLADASGTISKSAGDACNGGCGSSSINLIFSGVTNTLIFLVGAVSVIMIIIGGLRYILSNGDPKQAETGRNTVMYAVIGIIVAIAAYAIVGFVTTHIK